MFVIHLFKIRFKVIILIIILKKLEHVYNSFPAKDN